MQKTRFDSTNKKKKQDLKFEAAFLPPRQQVPLSLFRLTFSWFGVFNKYDQRREKDCTVRDKKKKNNNNKRGEAMNQTQTVKVGNTLFKSLEAQREQTESVTRNKASKKNKQKNTD